jgi:peptidoglycan/LPS O-acetylase OafA/YrhL
MRVVAALMVFFFHLGQVPPFRSQMAADVYQNVFGQGGWVGVSFFFVLSGFVLTWSSRPTDTARRFWRRRVAKVFPNHLVTSVAAILLLVNAGQALGGWKVVPAIFLLQSWFPQIEISSAANSVSWSLSCELLFYLSFPLLIRLVDRARPSVVTASGVGIRSAASLARAASASAGSTSDQPRPWVMPGRGGIRSPGRGRGPLSSRAYVPASWANRLASQPENSGTVPAAARISLRRWMLAGSFIVDTVWSCSANASTPWAAGRRSAS